jgi:hypothetical protein
MISYRSYQSESLGLATLNGEEVSVEQAEFN